MSKRFFSVDRIKQYDGVGGSGLVGKFLSGTTEGFVLTDISNINTSFTDYYVTGGTYNALTNTLTLNRQNGSVIVTGFTSGGGGGTGDTYVTGFTFNNTTYDLTIKQNNGQPDLISNLAVLATDVYVVSGVYNPSTGIVTYTNSSGGTFQVSGFTTGMTDSYTIAANLNGDVIEFDNNILGNNLYSVNLTPVLSGKTNLLLFNSHTADTNNPHQTTFNDLINTAHTHTISDVFNLQTELNSKIENGVNFGGGSNIFSGKSGSDLYFKTISGGSNTNIVNIGDVIKIDSSDYYVTGGTYNGLTNTLTLDRQNGSISISGFSSGGGSNLGSFGITIDGSGSVLSTGNKGYLTIPYSGIITGWSLISDQVGSCVIDVWKTTSGNIPTIVNTITGTEKPTLSSQQINSDLSLSSWLTSVSIGDVFAFNIDSVSTITRVNLSIFITKQ